MPFFEFFIFFFDFFLYCMILKVDALLPSLLSSLVKVGGWEIEPSWELCEFIWERRVSDFLLLRT